jgi:hypothetical protein
MDRGALSPGAKPPGREANHTIRLGDMVLKHKDSFYLNNILSEE